MPWLRALGGPCPADWPSLRQGGDQQVTTYDGVDQHLVPSELEDGSPALCHPWGSPRASPPGGPPHNLPSGSLPQGLFKLFQNVPAAVPAESASRHLQSACETQLLFMLGFSWHFLGSLVCVGSLTGRSPFLGPWGPRACCEC